MGVYGTEDQLVTIPVDSFLYRLGNPNSSFINCPAARLDVTSRLERRCAPLGVQLGLRRARLRGSRWHQRNFVIALPLVEGPAYAEPDATNGDQYYGRDKPILHSTVLFAPHYTATLRAISCFETVVARPNRLRLRPPRPPEGAERSVRDAR